jgi:hypothetical protein
VSDIAEQSEMIIANEVDLEIISYLDKVYTRDTSNK